MNDLLVAATLEAIRTYGDAAAERFYRDLRDKKLSSTRCEACGEVAFPPRGFCPSCHEQERIRWVELPTRGTVYAFTQQERSLRFGKPDVIGLVELPGVGRILTKIDAPFEALQIGQAVELCFVTLSEELTLHQFRPVVPG